MAVPKERVRLSAELVGSRETPTTIFAYGATHSRVAEAGMLCVGAEEGNSPFPLQPEGESGARGDLGVCCSKEANHRRSGASSCSKFCIACSLCFFHFVPYFSRRLRLRVSGWKRLLKLTPKTSLRGIGSFSFILFPPFFFCGRADMLQEAMMLGWIRWWNNLIEGNTFQTWGLG